MLKGIVSDFMKKPLWQLFILSWLFYLLGMFLYAHFVWDSNTYMLNYNGSNFEEHISNVRRIDLVRYVLSPIWVTFLAFCIWILLKMGLIFYNIKFNNIVLLKIILLGMMILSLNYWVESIWLILVKGNYSPDDVTNFYPVSIISFFDTTKLNEAVVKVISKFNLFQVLFILSIAWLITINSTMKYIKAFLLVFFTYGLGFIFLKLLIIVMVL